MAKALKCPACGATHRLDELDGATKFRCDECGQSLKVPNVTVATSAPNGSAADAPAPDGPASDGPASDAAAPDDAESEAPDSEAAASDVLVADATATETAAPMKLATAAVPPPPPRRRTPGAPRGREIIGASATISVADGDGVAPVSTPAPEREPVTRRRRVRWYWRLLAWIAAVPIGFVITVWPAYEFGLIRKDDVLDVFVGSGTGRYTRLAIVTVLWALATALLVQLFVEGGRWWAARRRERAASPPARSASATAS